MRGARERHGMRLARVRPVRERHPWGMAGRRERPAGEEAPCEAGQREAPGEAGWGEVPCEAGQGEAPGEAGLERHRVKCPKEIKISQGEVPLLEVGRGY